MNKIIFWSLTFIAAAFFAYLTSGTLAPFVIAFIFAYLLHPLIDNNAKKFHLPRSIVVLGIFIVFISSFVVGLMLLLPMIYRQIAAFIVKIPAYKDNFQEGVTYMLAKVDKVDPDIANKITDSLQTLINSAFSIIAAAANNVWGYTLATINFFAIIALVPIILYYFLRDWPKMVNSVESILPMKGKSKIGEIFSGINGLLSAYIRGQFNICILLSVYYVLGLSFIGLDLALLLGLLAGFMVIIPFIGTFISLSLALISCYFAYGWGAQLLYVLILFAVGYISESYFLTPKIIGDRIGLHPVWIIFAVFAAGSVFGFVGIIFAIPLAGIIKLLLSYIIDYYKSSKIYKG
jgi:putative permease